MHARAVGNGLNSCLVMLVVSLAAWGCVFDRSTLDETPRCTPGGQPCASGVCSPDGFCVDGGLLDVTGDVSDGVDTSDEACGGCQPGESCCEGIGCVSLGSDPDHCGACGTVCHETEACSGGVCVCAVGRGDCDASVEGCETNILENDAFCGSCAAEAACEAPASCTNAVCQCGGALCVPGQSCCEQADGSGTLCVDLERSPEHCGACGAACGKGEACVEGACRCVGGTGDDAPCGDGLQCCAGECIDEADTCNCGGTVCDLVCCGGIEAGVCVDIGGEAQHCGMCGNACATHANVVSAACSSGSCSYSCAPGFGDCDTQVTGCETSFEQLTSCGACNNDCTTHAHVVSATCQKGACEYVCEPGFGDCNPDVPGCETDLTQLANCGACGNNCAAHTGIATAMCVAGSCEYTCSPGFDDCDPSAPGCESNLSSPGSCGSCINVCAAGESCASGICGCAAPSLLCAGGVCTDVRSDAANCGACNNDCAAHANVDSATCSNGGCVYTCAAGFEDCDSAPGCETSSAGGQSCDQCSPSCRADQICEEGRCRCPVGQAACGASCVDIQSDIFNCGGCGFGCNTLPAAATTSCQGGVCAIGSCVPGRSNCNQNTADGCETLSSLCRQGEGVQALYELTAGSGVTAADLLAPAVPLTVAGTAAGFGWLPGRNGVSFGGSVALQASASVAAPLAQTISATDAFALEIWFEPANVTQSGPATLLAYGSSATSRNVALAQVGDELTVRVRTSESTANGGGDNAGLIAGGVPPISTTSDVLTAGSPTHVVVNYRPGELTLYVDGVLVASSPLAGELSNWSASAVLSLGADVDLAVSTDWAGEVYLVAIHAQRLSPPEIEANFEAGHTIP